MVHNRSLIGPWGQRAALALALVAACRGAEAPVERQAPALPVEVEPVTRGTIVDRITLNAEVEPIAQTRLASGAGGKVDDVRVKQGDRVAAGQLLATVAAGLAQARLHQAEAVLTSADASHARLVALRDKAMASAASLEKAATALAQARAGVELARAQYDDALIRAPHAGLITERLINKGELAVPGAPLFELVDFSTVKLVAQLPELDAPRFDAGGTASLTVDAYPGEVFYGEIERLGRVAQAFSRTYDLEIQVPNPEGRLWPGMLARINLVRQTVEQVVTVRRDAVLEMVDGRAVFAEREGRAQRLAVRLGPVEGGRVAVLDGLAVGDRVVVVGHRSLVDDQRVRVVAERQPVEAALAEPPARRDAQRPE